MVNPSEITINEATLIHLFRGQTYVGSTQCTKPDTYMINRITANQHDTDIKYERVFDTIQTYDGKQYDTWAVWQSQLK